MTLLAQDDTSHLAAPTAWNCHAPGCMSASAKTRLTDSISRSVTADNHPVDNRLT
jgi:hypothetical protein